MGAPPPRGGRWPGHARGIACGRVNAAAVWLSGHDVVVGDGLNEVQVLSSASVIFYSGNRGYGIFLGGALLQPILRQHATRKGKD
jgi:hypothetical protein